MGENSGSGGLLAGARRHRFDILLGGLVLLFVSGPLVPMVVPLSRPGLGQIIVTVMFELMLLSALFAVAQTRKTAVVAVWIAVPTVLLQALHLSVEGDPISIAAYAMSICFLGFTVIIILRFLFVNQRVTLNIICASLCVYLLLGVLWANAYSLIEILEPGSFRLAAAGEMADGAMRFGGEQSILPLYYSLVTLSTLGYGDVVPLSPGARMLAAMEAVTGQLYLAVLVARLVGLHIAQRTRLGG